MRFGPSGHECLQEWVERKSEISDPSTLNPLKSCDENEDEFLKCTADCPTGDGIIKKSCECYKYWGPLVLYE